MAYIDIDGHPTWVVDHGGDGEPVLLLHGGVSSSDMLLEVLGPALDGFRLLAFDRRGHGRTADTPGPMSYGSMADETVGVIASVVGSSPAHLVGFSDGANVAMHVALRRPDLARSLVLIGGNYHHDGLVPDFLDFDWDPGVPLVQLVTAAYGERSPDGVGHFREVLDKSRAMWATQPTLTTADLRAIEAPALVLVGDGDEMTLQHTCSLYESLPDGRLAVIPGTSHLVVLEQPDIVSELVLAFLRDHGPPQTLAPRRRGAPAGS